MRWIIVIPAWMNRFLFSFVSAMAFWPFILIRHIDMQQDPCLIRHEEIHLRQQVELLVLPFYLWYLTEYLLKLIKYRNHSIAYYNISFEREAYENEDDATYLSNRKRWAFLSYL